jgi:hypothetical protein
MRKHVSLTIRRPLLFVGRSTKAETLSEMLDGLRPASEMRSAIKFFRKDHEDRCRLPSMVRRRDSEELAEFNSYLAVPPTHWRRSARVERVRVVIPGQGPRTVNVEHREPLADVLMRICDWDHFPVDRVHQWYTMASGTPIKDIYNFRVEDGLDVCGTPQVWGD